MIVNKIKISNPYISLINHNDTPPNPTSTNMLTIADSGLNKHLKRQATHSLAPVNMNNEMKERLPYGSTMEFTHIATLQIPGLSKLARQIQIFPKIQTASLISLGVLCDYGCTITLDKQVMSIQNNEELITRGTRNKNTGMWEVPLGPKKSKNVVNNILAQTSQSELAQYLHAALFIPTTSSLLNAIKQGFLKTWPGLTENLIKNHREKSRNTTMGHLHVRRQGL